MSDTDRPEPEGSAVDPRTLYDRLAAGERMTLLDVRDRDEFEAWHVDGPNAEPVQVPVVKFLQAEVTGSVPDLAAEYALDGPVVAICARGEASARVADLLSGVGIDATNLADGMRGWARVYVAADLAVGGPGVRQYYRPSSGCLSYLVHDGDEAAVVDPLRAFAGRYADDAAALGAEVTAVVDTHVHADHFSGLREVADRAGVEPTVPEGAIDRGLAFEAATLADGDRIPVGAAAVEAIHAPGHTSEMTALRAGDALLSGDWLFLESVARPDLEAGDEGAPDLAARLHRTLHERLPALGDDTLVAPGHVGIAAEPDEDGTFAARLGDLRGRSDLLGLDREEFVARILGDPSPRPANYETIIEANLGRRAVGADEAFELELGPNNCAVS